MSTVELLLRLLAGVALTAANAFFVLTEFSLTRLAEMEDHEARDDPGLQRAWSMIRRLEIHLTGCQLGISSTSVLLGVVAEPAVTALLRPAAEAVGLTGNTLSATSVVVAVVIINLVHKIWGEQAPTYLGVERPRESARWTAPILYWWTKVTYPLIKLGDGLAKGTLGLFGIEIHRSWTGGSDGGGDDGGGRTGYSEVRSRIGEVLSRGELSRERQQEVLAALEIERMPVHEIMRPREEIVALRTGSPPEESFRTLAEKQLVRFPLVGDSLEDFVGIVYVPAVLGHLDALRDGSLSFREIAADPFELPADLPVSQAIDRFQEARQELALVRDDEGRVAGLVTATDAFEAIAGQLEDPLDPP